MKKPTEHEARQILADAKMRQGLFELLWKFHPDAHCLSSRPIPSLDDEHIKSELKRILEIR